MHETSRPLSIVGRGTDSGFEILELALPPYESVLPVPKRGLSNSPDQAWIWAAVRVESDPNAFAFVGNRNDPQAELASYQRAFNERQAARTKKRLAPERYAPPSSSPELRLWIRRPVSSAPPRVTFYTPSLAGEAGHRVPFHVEALPSKISGPSDVLQAWAGAAARFFESHPGAFFTFAGNRIKTRYLKQKERNAPSPHGGFVNSDVSRLMDTTTGRLAIQEALEHDRQLYLSASREKRSVPIEKVTPPPLTHHAWSEMLRLVGARANDEPLASATPAEFYFTRSHRFESLLDLCDILDDWGQPAADVLDGHSAERGTFSRYQDELGLERTGLARLFGPSVIDDVALVGSDPYVHEGSDLTLIFRVKHAALFDTGLGAALAARAKGHGELSEQQLTLEGVAVNLRESSDGRVHRYRASAGGFELLSNSKAALARVLSTIQGHHPKLADEPDFQYMLARDKDAAEDVLGYLGDRFVTQVVGPAQKIAEARRQVALAELSAPGYAALLAGWLNGKSPSTTQELVKAGWLQKSELNHATGGSIAFEPGGAARSAFGSVSALAPLIDQGEILRVTRSEERGYSTFASYYAGLWADKVDPIALRLTLAGTGAGGERTLGVDLRVLPLLRRDYREWIEMVGQARVQVPELTNGARIVAGIGKDARVRGLLDGMGRDFLDGKLKFDWLGDYVMFGVTNRRELEHAVLPEVREELERPNPDPDPEDSRSSMDERTLPGLPVYAVIALKSQVAAGLALTAIRQKFSEAAPDAASWQKAADYRGHAVVRVASRELGGKLAIFYCLLPNAFAISLNEAALHDAVDQVLDRPALATQAGQTGGQVVFEMGGEKQSAIYRILGWFASARLLENEQASQALVESILRGAPETQSTPARIPELMRAYFGSVVLTPDGRSYEASPEGPRDPVRGNLHAPMWPDVPVPGSPLDRVLSGLMAARSEQSYDTEPGRPANSPEQSLHIHATFKLRGAAR